MPVASNTNAAVLVGRAARGGVLDQRVIGAGEGARAALDEASGTAEQTGPGQCGLGRLVPAQRRRDRQARLLGDERAGCGVDE